MKKIALILTVVAAFAVPASAFASTDGYTNVAGVTQETGSTPGSGSTPSNVEAVATTGDAGSALLPFTGLQLALIFGAGVILLGTGLLLRRTGTR